MRTFFSLVYTPRKSGVRSSTRVTFRNSAQGVGTGAADVSSGATFFCVTYLANFRHHSSESGSAYVHRGLSDIIIASFIAYLRSFGKKTRYGKRHTTF